MEFQIYSLKNGIRLVHHKTDGPIGHCGIIINTGSRDELESEHGIAHLIEHLIFKGTKKRKTYHILSRMDDVGGEINAYTTKEETCIYATFFNQYYARAIELMGDITFNSVYPEKEIKKEKGIILDEINSYKDTPSELIFDEFEEMLFDGNPIGRNILGEEKSLQQISRNHILKFILRNYSTDQMVISSVGNISMKKLVGYVERYFGNYESRKNNILRPHPNGYVQQHIISEKSTYQAHCIIGNVAYSYTNEKRIGLHLLNNILGGPGLNSRLNLSLRERKAYAYNVDSSYHAFTDTGAFVIYFGTDKEHLNKCIRLVLNEFKLLQNHLLGHMQLKKAKQQLTGQLAISSENKENLMLSIGKSILLYNRVDTFGEIKEKIDRITAEDLCQIAGEILKPDKLSYLIYQ